MKKIVTEEKKFKVSEIFGPTIQGEGPSVGVPAIFLRLYGCSERCPFCDSAYSIEGGEYTEMTLTEIAIKINEIRGDTQTLIITGGEPLLQFDEKSLYRIFDEWRYNRIEIETNGNLLYKHHINTNINLNISPKLFDGWKEKYEPLNKWLDTNFINMSMIFKFVLEHGKNREKCITNILDFIETFRIPEHLVYIMTEGTSIEELSKEKMQEDIKFCLEHNFNYTPRLHILVWDKKRKV